MKNTLELKNISVKAKDKILFQRLNISLDEGEIMVIQGESGCGKSSLLKYIAGFIDSSGKEKNNNRKWFQENGSLICDGKIILANEELNKKDPRERSLGYLIQTSKIYPNLKTPKDVLEFVYRINSRIKKKYTKEIFSKKAKQIFDSLNFHIGYEEQINNISGGEEQRLLLAKNILLEPKLLLLDEPFSNLDYIQREKIREIIKNEIVNNSSLIKYIIMVSHDINDGKIADKILYFDKVSDNTLNSNHSFDYYIIEHNSFESAFDVFTRLYGKWKDNKNRKLKDNIITQIVSSLSNKDLITNLFNKFFDTFNINECKRKNIFTLILENNYNSDIDLEQKIKKVIYPLDAVLYENSLKDRSYIIFEEIKPFINKSDRILDVGCGDGRVANIIRNNNQIELTDIYKHPNIDDRNNTFKLMNSDVILPYSDNEFDSALLLTVLHHSNNPYKLLEETIRVVNNRIIIIESILGISKDNSGNFEIFKDKRLEYARLIDWIYNRIVYDDNVNVPYNFLCVEDWNNIFNKYNLKIVDSIDLGIDIKIVPEHHYLFVLEKE